VQSIESAKGRALLFLKFRPRSEAELKRRLSQLGYGAETVDQVVAEFKAKGLVDDEKFARYFAQSQMNVKPAGRRALAASLKAKGIGSELAAQAVEIAVDGKEDLEIARELARKRIGSFRDLEPEVVQRRLFGYLSRRGFASDVVYKVVREIV